MDPWFSPRGAFFGGWFQFPDNTGLAATALRGVGDICVSHNHGDHFDPEFLRAALAADPQRRVHIARFATPWFERLARASLGPWADRLEVHPPWDAFEVAPGVGCFFVPEESPAEVDAAMVAFDDRSTLLNLNDARLTTRQLHAVRALAPRSLTVALQASGASEYPINYRYPRAEMHRRKIEKRRLKLDHVRRIIEDLEPDRVLFFAGPPVFLDPSLARFNDTSRSSVFPDQLDIVRTFAREAPEIAEIAYFVMPGDTLSDDHLWPAVELTRPRYRAYTDKAAYIAEYRTRRGGLVDYDWGELPDGDELRSFFEYMVRCWPSARRHIDGELSFVVRGRDRSSDWTLDFRTGVVRRGTSEDALYVLTAPASSVTSIMAGAATWDDVFLSLRTTFDERTDRFVPHFKTLMRYLDREILDEVDRYEREMRDPHRDVPTLDVQLADGVYRIQRQCPHAGADLSFHGTVNGDGTITCMSHRFCFDIRSGRCTNVAGWQLRTEKIDPAVTRAYGSPQPVPGRAGARARGPMPSPLVRPGAPAPARKRRARSRGRRRRRGCRSGPR
jgi:UDP-MurNAc hydroxylase